MLCILAYHKRVFDISLFQESIQIFLACGSNAVNIIRGTVANFVSSCNFSVSFENQQCTIKLCRCYINVLANIVKKLATVHFLNVQTNQNVTLQRFFCQLNKHSISPFLKNIIPFSFGFVNRFLTKAKKTRMLCAFLHSISVFVIL